MRRWRLLVKEFVMQWHISEACNLKCLHCYQENNKPIQLEYNKLLNILNQYKELLKEIGLKGHINLTGGEPLCSPHFFKLLEEFKKDKDLYTFSVLTNGTLITKEIAERISKYKPTYVQVSLEGGKKTNDYIRGKSVYKKVGEVVKLLKKQNVYVSISFTATSKNYKEFPKVVKYAEKLKVDNVWSDRFIPLGTEHDMDFKMSKDETQAYLRIMQKERVRLKEKKSKTTVAMYRALQFQMTHDYPYRCTAGDYLLTVMENGDLVPCRRMPIVVGNLLKDNMLELYRTSPILKELQEQKIPKDCKKCEHSERCRGGLKCLTYAVTNNYNLRDVGCNLEE